MKKYLVLFGVLLVLSACNSSQKIVYMQRSGVVAAFTDTLAVNTPDPTVKSGDVLNISVRTFSPETSAPFNVISTPALQGSLTSQPNATQSGYIVDKNGNINFPVVGLVHVAGLEKYQIEKSIKEQIFPKYIKEEPVVDIRMAEFKVSVIGEVSHPGVVLATNERLSIFEAIAQAGDLTIYGRRDNVLLIREMRDGRRQTVRLDLRDKHLLHSAYYYLQQNDVLYIEPNVSRSRSSYFGSAEMTSVSIVSSLLSITSLLITIFRK